VCFLNSDVFAMPAPAGVEASWLDRLARHLTLRPDLGAVGPLLLFEDGSVQHQGLAYAPIPRLGGWRFPVHPRKGWRPDPALRGLHEVPALTAACLLLRRKLALELGGFDEAYAIGDFEDSDLCQKLAARGLRCALDHDVRLYHLERKSQAAPQQRWRANLTLFNAWLHQNRWFAAEP
jgi:GT2 family glycosyltransferase